jgi:hypothetical protein
MSDRLANTIVASNAASSKLAEHNNAGTSRRAHDALSHVDRVGAGVSPQLYPPPHHKVKRGASGDEEADAHLQLHRLMSSQMLDKATRFSISTEVFEELSDRPC